MKTTNSTFRKTMAVTAAGCLIMGVNTVGKAQAYSAAAMSPDLQEVVKLSQARMPEDIIQNYIINTGKSYRLSADDILYLNNQGVSASVISTLQTGGVPAPAPEIATAPPQTVALSQPALPPPATTTYATTAPTPAAYSTTVVETMPPPPPVVVNYQYFHDQLSPYGSWVTVGGVTYWRPDQALAINPDWRPYYDMGQWVETDDGLYWQSEYTWGDIPFHYGRWVLNPAYGWLWVPDYTWGPAWVFWRHDEVDRCIGWAPLPMGAVFVDGGFRFNGLSVSLDFDFGLGESCFTFVSYEHFHEPFFRMRGREWDHHYDHNRVHSFYGHSVVRNEFHHDDHGRFVNNGIGRDRVEKLTKVQHMNFEERSPVGNRGLLANTRTEQRAGKIGNMSAGNTPHGQNGASGNNHDNHGAQAATQGNGSANHGHDTKADANKGVLYQKPEGDHAQKAGGQNDKSRFNHDQQHNSPAMDARQTVKSGDQNTTRSAQNPPQRTQSVNNANNGHMLSTVNNNREMKTGADNFTHNQNQSPDQFKAPGNNSNASQNPRNTSAYNQKFMTDPGVNRVYRPPNAAQGGGNNNNNSGNWNGGRTGSNGNGNAGAIQQRQSQPQQPQRSQGDQQHDRKKTDR